MHFFVFPQCFCFPFYVLKEIFTFLHNIIVLSLSSLKLFESFPAWTLNITSISSQVENKGEKNGQWKRMRHNPWRSLSLLDGTHAAVQLSLLSSLFFFSTSFLYRRQTQAHGIGTLGYRLIGNPNIDHGRKKSCTHLFSFEIWDNLWNSKQLFITRRNFDLKSTKTYWYVVWKTYLRIKYFCERHSQTEPWTLSYVSRQAPILVR